MAYFSVLDQASEDNLHAKRLLNIEEKPFKRLSKRLLAPTNPLQICLNRAALGTTDTSASPAEETTSDDPDSNLNQQNGLPRGALSTDAEYATFLKSLTRFRQDCLLDFAAFESSIARIQLLRTANERERARYASEKLEIEDKAQTVQDNTTKLRTQLEEAKRTMEVRKGYDVLAEGVMKSEKTRRTREELRVSSDKLKEEIEELEREGVDLQQAWKDRRDQLSIVVNEASRLRRIVRGEPEPGTEQEGEHRDDEDEEDGKEEDEMIEGQRREEDGLGVDDRDRDRDGGSHMGTPRPIEDAPTPLPALHESGVMTPRSNPGEAEVFTPKAHAVDDKKSVIDGLDVDMLDDASKGVPTVTVDKADGSGDEEEGEDVEMS